MKRAVSIAFMAVLMLPIAHCATAQSETGLRTGFSLLQVSGADIAKADQTPGFYGGLYQVGNTSRLISLQRELLVSYKSLQFNHQVGKETRQITGKLYYLELPVLLSLNLRPGFSLMAGPQGSMRIGNQFDTKFNKANDLYTANKFDVALVGGIALRTKAGVDLGLRYSHGFRSMVSMQEQSLEPTESQELDIRNSSLQFNVGIRLGGKSKMGNRTNPKFKDLPDMFYQNANFD